MYRKNKNSDRTHAWVSPTPFQSRREALTCSSNRHALHVRVQNMLALRAETERGLDLPTHEFCQNFCFSDT